MIKMTGPATYEYRRFMRDGTTEIKNAVVRSKTANKKGRKMKMASKSDEDSSNIE